MEIHSCRADILQYAAQTYQTVADYPWEGDSISAVLRHAGTRKWYGILMRVRWTSLGEQKEGYVDIVNLRCDPATISSLRTVPGFYPAYHMHKGNWITVLLDGSVDKGLICSLLDDSFLLTKKRTKARKSDIQ